MKKILLTSSILFGCLAYGSANTTLQTSNTNTSDTTFEVCVNFDNTTAPSTPIVVRADVSKSGDTNFKTQYNVLEPRSSWCTYSYSPFSLDSNNLEIKLSLGVLDDVNLEFKPYGKFEVGSIKNNGSRDFIINSDNCSLNKGDLNVTFGSLYDNYCELNTMGELAGEPQLKVPTINIIV